MHGKGCKDKREYDLRGKEVKNKRNADLRIGRKSWDEMVWQFVFEKEDKDGGGAENSVVLVEMLQVKVEIILFH